MTEEVKKSLGNFLDEYMELCLKHQVYLATCGCCGSPWLQIVHPDDEDDKDTLDKHHEHLKKEMNL